MAKSIKEIKRELASLAKYKDTRMVGIWPDDPPNWRFGEVIDPRSGKPFTPGGCWDFIAEELEKGGTTICKEPLKVPRGKVGYVFFVNTVHGEIYIKVRLGKGKIIGRSFHY